MITPDEVADLLEELARRDRDGLVEVLGEGLDRYALARLHALARSRLGRRDSRQRMFCPWCQAIMIEADFGAHLEQAHAEQLAAQ